MSKRHQSSRRRTYGRRQHEVHERHHRAGRYDAAERRRDRDVAAAGDSVAHLGPRAARDYAPAA
jgi:hypothetical protein